MINYKLNDKFFSGSNSFLGHLSLALALILSASLMTSPAYAGKPSKPVKKVESARTKEWSKAAGGIKSNNYAKVKDAGRTWTCTQNCQAGTNHSFAYYKYNKDGQAFAKQHHMNISVK